MGNAITAEQLLNHIETQLVAKPPNREVTAVSVEMLDSMVTPANKQATETTTPSDTITNISDQYTKPVEDHSQLERELAIGLRNQAFAYLPTHCPGHLL